MTHLNGGGASPALLTEFKRRHTPCAHMVDSRSNGPTADSGHICDDDIGTAYGLLLEHPEWGAGQVAQGIGLDEQNARSLLDHLVELSLVRQPDADGGQFLPVSPMIAMQQLIDRERALLDASQQRLRERYMAIDAALSRYTSLPAAGDSAGGFQALKGIDAVQHCLEDLAVQCRSEVLSFNPAADDSPAARASLQSLARTALARRATIRIIYPDSVVYDHDTYSYCTELRSAGAQVALAGRLPMRMLIVDRRVALLPDAQHDGWMDGVILIREPNSVAALITLFDVCWDQATPAGDERPGEVERSEIEHHVLHALAEGMKDEAVARQLNVSVRTVRRVVSDLMARSRARSRFELGVRAAARGWIC